jgi:Flavodoxins
MSKVLLAYTSMSGRNEQIADHIEDYLNNNGVEVEKEQLVDADAYSATDYDGLIVVTYTYGDGQVPDEAQDFYEDIEDVDLEHMKFYCFRIQF